MSQEGMLRRGKFYHEKLMKNKELPKDKQLTIPKQVDDSHPEVLLYRSTIVVPKVEKKAEPKPKAKEVKK